MCGTKWSAAIKIDTNCYHQLVTLYAVCWFAIVMGIIYLSFIGIYGVTIVTSSINNNKYHRKNSTYAQAKIKVFALSRYIVWKLAFCYFFCLQSRMEYKEYNKYSVWMYILNIYRYYDHIMNRHHNGMILQLKPLWCSSF